MPERSPELPKNEARRVKRGNRIVILPPTGYGDVWFGAAGRVRLDEAGPNPQEGGAERY